MADGNSVTQYTIPKDYEEMTMLDRDVTTNTEGARELIARLGAAMMIADGHISESELSAVECLRGLGLGSLSAFVDAEVERAMRTPIDVARTAAALAEVTPPQAGAVVLSALAQIAASDRELSRRELEILGVIATALDVDGEEAAHVIRCAAARYSAPMTDQFPPSAAGSSQIKQVPLSEPPRASDPSTGTAPEPRGMHAEVNWALPVLGLAAGASKDEIDAAYATLIRRYNPATVIELGPEFAVLAVQRLNAVTAAYVAARQALASR